MLNILFLIKEENYNDNNKLKPWEENNGYYGILSRLVKQFSPSFIFTVKTCTIDHNYLNRDQIINHFNRNGTFTTKVSDETLNSSSVKLH